jgi:hypothetical protein
MSQPLAVLRERAAPERPGATPAREQAVTRAEDRWLHCRPCGARIAPLSALLPSNTPLVFANPSGMVFELVLLRDTCDLRLVGPATEEFTWFAGYAWRVALCHACATHLGWRFDAVGLERLPRGFFGLLRRELVEQAGRAD